MNFEDYLMEQHDIIYTGTSDDAPDAFEAWVSELTIQELIDYANSYGLVIRLMKDNFPL